jgi:hypothetical protein
MRWSTAIGRFGWTAVKLHIAFILFLDWIAFSARFRGAAAAALDGMPLVELLFACVALRELRPIAAAPS